MRGNGIYVCIPRQMQHFLGWNIGEMITVEVIDGDSLRVRRATESDLRTGVVSSVNFELPRSLAK
jgi:antitoxin component of MazEF toxin-antitoxin module